MIALLALRRFRHLLVFVGSFLAVLLVVRLATVDRPRPFGVELRGSWGGWAMPSRPVAILAATLVGVLYTLVPVGRWRQLGKWIAAGLVAAFALARIHLGVDAPTDALLGAVIGVAVSVAAYRLFVPNEIFPVTYKRGRSAHLDVGGRRGEAIRQALADQLGLTALEVEPFGLSGSAGSTPLRIQIQDQAGTTRYVFGKLYARSHLRADRSYKLGRALLYGRLEDEKPFNTVKRLVQQEDYALALMARAGLPSPEPYGVAELTPEREYLIVFEFIDGAKEIGDAEVDDAIIDQGLGIVRKLWDANLAHRDIKPANLLVRDGKLYLIDVFFAEIHPSPWRQAVDLANMMLCLALRSSPEQVYERALQQFTVGEISEAFAAARGLALPSQLRKLMRAQGRNLHGEFIRLLPEPPRPIGVQRWSTRRVALLRPRPARVDPRHPAGLGVRPLQRQPRRRRSRHRRERVLHPAPGAVAAGTISAVRLPHPLRPRLPRRHRRRAGCPRRRVGARTQPRQPRHQHRHRRPAPSSRRGRRGDDPAHRIVRRPVHGRGGNGRARRPSLPDPRTRQHTREWSTCSPAAVSPTGQTPTPVRRSHSSTKPSARSPTGPAMTCATPSGGALAADSSSTPMAAASTTGRPTPRRGGPDTLNSETLPSSPFA